MVSVARLANHVFDKWVQFNFFVICMLEHELVYALVDVLVLYVH